MKFGLQFECNCLLGHLLLAIVVVVDYFQNCSPHLSIIHTFKTIHLLDYMILLSFFAIVTTIAILYYLLDVSLINAYNLLQVCNSCINQKSHLTSMQYNYTACSNIKLFLCVLSQLYVILLQIQNLERTSCWYAYTQHPCNIIIVVVST